jgi:hypothetical protein
MPGTKFDAKARFTVRNLRIREDTAKYLFNLDTESAFYDPKTRTMRADPLEGLTPDQRKQCVFLLLHPSSSSSSPPPPLTP